MSEPTPQQPLYAPQDAQQAYPQQPQPPQSYQQQPVGQQAPQPQYTPQPPSQQKPRKPMRYIRVWLPAFVLMIVLDVLGCLFLVGCFLNVSGTVGTSTVNFAQVADKCENAAATMSGDDDSLSAEITYDGIDNKKPGKAYDCLVSELGIPSSTVNKIDNTRTLDGMQSDTWDGIKVTWSYSADTDSDWNAGTLQMTFEHVK